jgi:nucleotide-binding universal stress UspA family protein
MRWGVDDMKILAAVDGTVHAHDAVKYLVDHVDWYRETPAVELVYVHAPLPRLPDAALSVEQIRRYYEDEGNSALASAKHTLERAGIAYTSHIAVGPTAEMIVKEARRLECDLILVGTKGLGADGNVLLGSTATKVLYFAPMPVFVVKSSGPC